MRRKWKIGLFLAGAAAVATAVWLRPSREPVYEGKRLSEWLDVWMRFPGGSLDTNGSFGHVTRAIQAIGTNAIPFLLRDMERKELRWLERAKDRAYNLKVMDETHLRRWRLSRSASGFQVLGTNAAPALERLLVLFDAEGDASDSAVWAVVALGPIAVPDLVKRLRATNCVTRERAAFTLRYIGGPAAESAIPSLVAMLDDTNTLARQNAVRALTYIDRQPERLVPLFRSLLGDSNGVIRMHSAYGLLSFGPSAKEAVPDLLRAANDSDPDVSNAVRQALNQIDPSALNALSR